MKRIMIILIATVCMVVLATSGLVAAAPPSNPGKANEKPADITLVKFVDYATPSPFPGFGTEDNESFKTRADAKWAVPTGGVPYTVYTGGAPSGALAVVQASFEEWDNWVGIELFAVATDVSSSFPGVSRNDVNQVGWAYIDGEGSIIAAAYVWFNMRTKVIVEFDIVFDSSEPWGDGGYDIQNVATHEAGHTLFLDDLYMPFASALTMFGYVDVSETQKQSLGKGDMLGVQKLYGPGPAW